MSTCHTPVTRRPFSARDLRNEIKGLVALASASGVISLGDLGHAADRSKSLALHWADVKESGDLPVYVLFCHEGFRQFMQPHLDALWARVREARPRSSSPENGANVVFSRVGEWMIGVTAALTDQYISPTEAKELLELATRLRQALDNLTDQLSARASEPAPAPLAVVPRHEPAHVRGLR